MKVGVLLFKFIIWGVIVLILFLLRKRIGGVVVGIITLIATVFLFVAMMTNFAPWSDLRGMFDLRWYDNTVNDPGQTAKDLGDKAVNTGKAINDKVEEEGKKLDDKFGIETSSDTEETQITGVYGKKGDKATSKVTTPMTKDIKLSREGISFKDINNYIKSNPRLTKKDKSLLRGATVVLHDKVEGDTISFKVKGERIVITEK